MTKPFSPKYYVTIQNTLPQIVLLALLYTGSMLSGADSDQCMTGEGEGLYFSGVGLESPKSPLDPPLLLLFF